jgi:hypothetical protein
LDELKAFERAGADSTQKKAANICTCKSAKYAPSWPTFFEWVNPRVLGYTLKLVLARGLAPWCEKHFQAALPLIERAVRRKEA